MQRAFLVLIFLLPVFIFGREYTALIEKIAEPAPSWVSQQITRDLTPFQKNTISLKEMDAYFSKYPCKLVKVELCKGKMQHSASKEVQNHPGYHHRFPPIYHAIALLAELIKLPDLTCYICIDDGGGSK